MNATLITRRRMIVASSMLSLAGCSLLPDPPAPQMYRLNPAVLDPSDSKVLHSGLVIDVPTAPTNLDSDRIALTRGATRFDYFADSTWTDRVPRLLQAMLVEAFEANGQVTDVSIDPDAMVSGYLLQSQVRAFTARYDEQAINPPIVDVRLEMHLVRLPGHIVGRTLITGQSTAAVNNVRSVVLSFDIATGMVLSRCVAWTLKAMQS